MRDALCHRGPDDFGIEVIDNVGLVHTRLSIVDLSARGHQPMRHPSGAWWLAYNGEIYNHLELRADLGDVPFVGDSDTETLLWSLERWGTDAVTRLTGQFAFAALDLREGRLMLCRDRFGIKPLYLAEFAGGVWFASEPAALIAAGLEAEPVEHAWQVITAGTYLGGPATLLKGVTRAEPGSWTTISIDTGEVTHSMWHVPADDVDPGSAARLTGRRRSDLTTELESTLRTVVHRSLLSDAKVGTLCSGGVDSSLITALAVEAKPEIVAFGAGCTTDPALDEGPAAMRVAEALGIEIELVDVVPDDFRRDFVSATIHSGGPIANASAVTVLQLARRARECGVKVLMTGEGADELFGGYNDLHRSALGAFLPWYNRVIRSAEPELMGDPDHAVNPIRVLRKTKHLVGQAIGRPLSSVWMPLQIPDGNHDPSAEATAAYAHHDGERGRLEAALLSRLDYTLCWLLNRMDKNVMQTSVEARVPFLEPEVVSLALNLPLEARVGPWSKGILRDVARRVLPWSIAHRPKIYGMDFDSGWWIEEAADPSFLADGVLRDRLGVPSADFEHEINRAEGVRKLRLWSAEVWCRSAVAGQTVEQIEQELWR